MNSHLKKFLQVVREPLADLLPGLRVEVSEPYHPTGVWIVNLFLDDYHLMVQYTEERGFGLTAGDDDWGTSVDEAITDAGNAVVRVLELLRVKGRTIPTTTLQGLRAKQSQREIAEAMDIKQPSYARMESEELSKLKVHTLQKIVAASKGKLHLLVETLDGQYLILNAPMKKNSEVKYNFKFGRDFSESVPLHLVNLTPRRVDCSPHGKVLKGASEISTQYHFGDNVSLIRWINCGIEGGAASGELWGKSYSSCFLGRDISTKKFESNTLGSKRELRLIK